MRKRFYHILVPFYRIPHLKRVSVNNKNWKHSTGYITMLIKERSENREKQTASGTWEIFGRMQWKTQEQNVCIQDGIPPFMPLLLLWFWDKCDWSEKKREVVIIPLKQTRNTEAAVNYALCACVLVFIWSLRVNVPV